MLEALPIRTNHRHPLKSKALSPKHTLNLKFKVEKNTFIQSSHTPSFTRSFYHSMEPPSSHRYSKHKRIGRETSDTPRSSIIGTPFSTLQYKQAEHHIPILPSFDRERYKFLLSAVSGMSRGKKMPQYHISKASQDFVENVNMKQYVGQCPQSFIGSPRIVNVSVPLFEQEKQELPYQNTFQKVFKNKRLLQKGRYNSFRQNNSDNFHIFFLGDEELTVKQATIKKRKQSHK